MQTRVPDFPWGRDEMLHGGRYYQTPEHRVFSGARCSIRHLLNVDYELFHEPGRGADLVCVLFVYGPLFIADLGGSATVGTLCLPYDWYKFYTGRQSPDSTPASPTYPLTPIRRNPNEKRKEPTPFGPIREDY